MKAARWTSLTLAAAGVLGIVLISTAGAAPAPQDGDPCKRSARATLKTARHEAHADFWQKIAVIFNDPECDFGECVQEAWAELAEDLLLARAQYDARLEICEELGGGPYDPDIDPEAFTAIVDNQYFPLVPGRTLIYEKQTDEGLERVETRTLMETIEIDGFPCRQVRDVEFLDDEVVEDTIDWYSQESDGGDEDGDVWYMGEISKNFEDGFLDNLDGSWRTGRDDAKPGIIMLASPEEGDFYRQEYYINEAEDVASVVSLNETVVVPYGTFHNCLQTEEFNALEPGNFEYKYYAPGIGLVLEVDPENNERLELVDIVD